MDKGAWWTSVHGVTKCRTQQHSTTTVRFSKTVQNHKVCPVPPVPNTHHPPQQRFNFVHVNHQLFLFSKKNTINNIRATSES